MNIFLADEALVLAVAFKGHYVVCMLNRYLIKLLVTVGLLFKVKEEQINSISIKDNLDKRHNQMGRFSAIKNSSEMESCALCLWIPSRSVRAFQAAHICSLVFSSLKAGQAI